MNKIIKSLSVIAFVAAIALAGTQSYFSDTETSTGNTFTAGTIDIDIDENNPFTGHYDIGDLKPGETGYMNFRIENVGTNPANISKRLYRFAHTDLVAGTDAGFTCTDGSKTVQVSSEPEFLAEGGTFDDNGNCNASGWSAKDYVQSQIIYDLSVEVYAGDDETGGPIWWQTIYKDSDNKKLTDVYGGGKSVALGMIPAGGHMNVTQSYHFNPNAGNKYQGDGLSFDMEIKADQMAQVDGYTTVALENKAGAPDWHVISGDNIEGTLNYKTKGATFDYNFSGKVKTTGNYTLLYVGSSNNYPCTGSVVLGTGHFTAGSDGTLSGRVNTGSITNGKIWLIPSSSYSEDIMISWPESNILFETALINYEKN